MKIKFLSRLVGIFAGTWIAATASATDTTTEAERQLLVRIAVELEYVQALANTALSASDPDRRIQFNYAALISDLQEIQAAVERHADQPQRTPRILTPVKKHYTP
ncbi:MAG: RAQPRD family integrative conjugative element protein [Cellvibrionaceae bacterium]|nr:RAQPRD family integrative conjugative element protein [Cellvibrionaceae bacterium]